MALESASYISQLVATYPLGSDSKSQGDDHLRLIKNVLKTQFGSLGESAVTTTAEEINILDGATVTTEELNYVDGVTSAIQDQIDSKEPTQTAATQVEMEEGTETAIRSMSPYRVRQAIDEVASGIELGFYPTWTPVSKALETWHEAATDVIVRCACPTTGYYSVDVGTSSSVYKTFGYKGSGSNGSQASAHIPVAAGQFYQVRSTFSEDPVVWETRI